MQQFTDTPSSRALVIPTWVVVVLFLAYALPGNVGHAPWRGDDVLHIDVAFEMLRNGDWLVPRIAGIPYLDWPPLTYWLGASLGALFGWLIPLHDAIRLATVLALAVSMWSLRATAKQLFGGESGNAAFLLSLGSLGLLIHAHEAQAQMVMLATVGCTLYGLAILPDHPLRGGVVAGFATGATILAGGLAGAILTVPLWLLLPLACRDYRQTSLILTYVTGIGIALLVAALWPFALALFQPEVLQAWWQQEVIGILPHTGNLAQSRALTQLLAWFTWPLWPVAGWAIWRRRQQLTGALFLPLASLVLAAWLVVTTGSLRPANVMPLLPALILLAAAEMARLRRGAANAFDWFGIMSVCAIGVFLWLAWFGLHMGWPAPLARNVARLLPGFVPSWSWWGVSIAIMLSVAWILAIIRVPYFPLRGAVHQALGVTLAWTLAIILWQDWFDYDKNYRPVAAEIATQYHRYEKRGCLATLGAGDSQRAALYYFEGLRIDPTATALKRCPILITYATARNPLPVPGGSWQQIWRKERGRGRQAEQFALYRRTN